jgi:hypothetical protein
MLKIDVDYKPSKYWLSKWVATRCLILKEMGYKVLGVEVFQTERGFHAYIKIENNVDDEELNMLQFLCGDDHTRVKINEWRIKRGIKDWNRLFHKVIYRKQECWYCGNKIPIQ